tara:strand:- start:746 stop:1198 length:453 start_codon:yes stop_codon:yes gene_type:complete
MFLIINKLKQRTMTDLPWFKFNPNQWLTGTISFLSLKQQGSFMKVVCYYWSKECKVPFEQYKRIIPDDYESLIKVGIVKQKNKNIVIDWLDKQYKERKEAHNKRVESGRKGGKHSLSNAKALRKDKNIKDKYENDNVLKVSDEVKKLLTK